MPGSGGGPLRARGSTGECRAVAVGHLGHGDCGVPGSGGGPLRAQGARRCQAVGEAHLGHGRIGGRAAAVGKRRGAPRLGGPR